MTVENALQKRSSIRGFLPTPVPKETLERILSTALGAPSSCNVQSWNIYIASGQAKEALSQQLRTEINSGKQPYPDFDWLMGYEGVLRDRQFGAAAALYNALGIDRKDRPAREEAMLRNWEFFGAPHVAFFSMEKYLGYTGAVDLGIMAQTIALLLAENGIGSCLQGALNQFPGPVRKLFNIPETQGILFGMSFGYRDPEAPANKAQTTREPLESLITFME